MQTCSRCKQTKPPEAFAKNQKYCRKCNTEYVLARRDQAAANAAGNKWYYRHLKAIGKKTLPEIRAEAQQQVASGFLPCKKCGCTKPLSDFGLYKRSITGYKYHCRPCENAYAKRKQKEYYAKTPERFIGYEAARRTLMQGGDLTPEDIVTVLRVYGAKCLNCDTEKSITIDHIVPLSKGGQNTRANIQPLCKSCNSRKSTKTIDYRPDGGRCMTQED